MNFSIYLTGGKSLVLFAWYADSDASWQNPKTFGIGSFGGQVVSKSMRRCWKPKQWSVVDFQDVSELCLLFPVNFTGLIWTLHWWLFEPIKYMRGKITTKVGRNPVRSSQTTYFGTFTPQDVRFLQDAKWLNIVSVWLNIIFLQLFPPEVCH